MDSGLEKIFENAVNFKNISGIYTSLLLDNKKARTGLEIRERKYKYPEGKCFEIKIDIDPALIGDKCVDLLILLGQKEQVKVNLKITDPNREYFMSDSFSFSGREIKKNLDPKLGTTLDIYRVQMHEFENLEEDN